MMKRFVLAAIAAICLLPANAQEIRRASVRQENWTGVSTANDAGGTTYYVPCDGTTNLTTLNEVNASSMTSLSGRLRRLRAKVTVAPGSGQNKVMTWYVNALSTSATCTIADTNTSCGDDAHAVAIADGQTCSVQVVASATAAASRFKASAEFD